MTTSTRRWWNWHEDADLLIHDGQYTPDELEGKRGWGHSSWAQAVEVAERAGVKRLAVFHHDEPLAGIDFMTREAIIEALITEWRDEASVILSTHEIKDAEALFDRVVFLREGEIILDERADALRSRGESVVEAYRSRDGMRALGTLLWLEIKKSYPLLLGTLLFFAILAPGIANIPQYGGGHRLRTPQGRPARTARRTSARTSGPSFWSFSWSSSIRNPRRKMPAPAASIRSSDSAVSAPSRHSAADSSPSSSPRRCSPAILLLGFFVTHYRESDSGEIALLYQTPISGDLQLWVRFGFMILCVGAINDVVLGYYWVLQRSQGLEFFGPVAAGLGHTYQLDWINITLIGILLFAFPIAAFILLFCQVQNAYGLLNRRRLAGLVLVIASLQSIALSMGWVIRALEPDARSGSGSCRRRVMKDWLRATSTPPIPRAFSFGFRSRSSR